MRHFELKNPLLALLHRELGQLPPLGDSDAALLPATLMLQDYVGLETALIWIEAMPLVEDLAKHSGPLNVKPGLLETVYGPVLSLAFWVPDPTDADLPLASVGWMIDPFDPEHLAPLRALDRQSDWHILVVDAESRFRTLFWLRNHYHMGRFLDMLEAGIVGMPHVDFELAAAEFRSLHAPSDPCLFRLSVMPPMHRPPQPEPAYHPRSAKRE